jgi:hypothetical protein
MGNGSLYRKFGFSPRMPVLEQVELTGLTPPGE